MADEVVKPDETPAPEAKATEQPKAVETPKAPETKPEEKWKGLSAPELLAALHEERDAKLRANGEAKERRLKLEELEAQLSKYKEAEKMVEEENLQATELLKKRDGEILEWKTKYTNLEKSIARDKVVSKVTEALVSKGFDPKLVKVTIAADKGLTEDSAEDFVKDFTKEWKHTLAPAKEPEKPKPTSPWSHVQAPASDPPESTPGRTPAEKQFNALFPAKK